MSFQSLLESTECGTSNPMVDLARQLASASTTNVAASNSIVPGGENPILSLDELNALNQQDSSANKIPFKDQENNSFASAVESLLLNNDNLQSSPFNMESLLEEISRMESRMMKESISDAIDGQNVQNVFKTDLDPLICNQPASIEEDFWHEATQNLMSGGSGSLDKVDPLDFQRYSSLKNKLPELNVDWADEYLKKLELNNTADDSLLNDNDNPDKQQSHGNVLVVDQMFDQQQQPEVENINGSWDLNEKEHQLQTEQHKQQAEDKSYRNQTIENVNSFFSQSYLPFLRPFNTSGTTETISDVNLNDLVSDQESRLINMLLGNNLSQENVPPSPLLPPNVMEREKELNKVQESKSEDQKSNQTEQVDDVSNTVSSVQRTSAKEPSTESFFYENQFDDMEFWMKLAEEWHSNDDTELLGLGAHLGEDGKMIQIREPLDNLLQENHPYYYQYVENNPFVSPKVESSIGDQEENASAVDYIGEGLRRMKAGDLSAAVLLFEAATQEQPYDTNAWRLLGIANAKNENDHKSIAALKRCLALNSSTDDDQLEALMYLATSFTNESMTTEACYTLQEWLRQHPKYRDLVRDQTLQKHKVQVDQKSEPYLGPTPLSQRWTSDRKNIFTDGFFESVKQSFIDAALKLPDQPDPDVQCGLGVLHNLSGEYEKATDCFRSALKSRPDDYSLWNRYGASLANGGRAEESMFAYREALIRYPGYIRARYNLAISCIMLGTGNQAAEHLLAVLNLQIAGADSVKDLISLNRDNITSASVWSLMRSALSLQGRTDLLNAVDERDLDRLNRELNFQQATEQLKQKPEKESAVKEKENDKML